MKRKRAAVALIVALVVLTGAAVAATSFLDTQGEIPLKQPGGPQITVSGDTDLNLETPFRDPDSVHVETASHGNLTVTSSGATSADVAVGEIEGPWTNLTDIDTASADLTITPGDKQPVVVGGSIDQFNYSTMAVDDGAADFTYTASGSASATVQSLPADTRVGAYEVASDTWVDTADTDGSGTATLSLDAASRSIELRSSDGAPQVSSPSPSGPRRDGSVSTLEVQVNDSDFSSNYDVTVEFFHEGNSVGTDTLSANGTASTGVSIASAGTNDWSVVATDEFGQETVQNYSFQIPDTLVIYEERSPQTKVSPAEVNVTFVQDDRFVSRSTTTGEVNLTNLPVDQQMVIVAEASGYQTRRIVIDSIYEQQQVYLLDSTASTSNVEIFLDDQTGEFSNQPIVRVLKPIDANGDGNETFQVLWADRFEASGSIEADLLQDDRVRFEVRNDNDQIRELGHYTVPASDDDIQLTIGSLSWNIGDDSEGNVRVSTERFTQDGDDFIRVQINQSEQQLEDVNLQVYETGNKSNATIYDQTKMGPFGKFSTTVRIPPENENVTAWSVNWTGDVDGRQVGGNRLIGAGDYGVAIPASNNLVAAFAAAMLTFVAGFFSVRTAEVGVIIVPVVALGLYAVGWLPLPLTWVLAALTMGVATEFASRGGFTIR